MHEYLLYSQVSPFRLQQVLGVLAGVTAAQPARIYEQCLLYQQLKLATHTPSSKKTSAGQSSVPQRLHYHKLLRHVTSNGGHLSDAGPWSLRIEDLPEPGVKTVTSRGASDTQLEEGDLEKLRGGSSIYKYIDQWLFEGYRFVDGNVVIKVGRIMTPPEGVGYLEPLDAPLPALSEYRLLDPCGTYVVEASVQVDDGTNSKLSEQATRDLLALKKLLEGAIDLRVPDRLSLDTRVKT